ncbi:MAG: large conductance mechanosensitive channel protein MscL [Clostridiaceae bacterium]|jgi:large conductance mechanosensitive channel|nr:large conductance mechanosensitive channel protein MscL [Clostridiales bacterium]MDD2441082.1 large conductance mechanosensitive channel protein MscL [Eubacteriales bacterium]MDD4139237.1 large conductance mechanosensitive channel protein MscL [Eubacteriales bacterium]NLB44299.1 large conductance mechanosensitive channel protein MscL [Clostridiaceae bacterium]
MFAEFKKFILRGNAVDLAIAVVIGGAFSAVVNSIVNHIIMPVIGWLIADVNFADLKIVLSEAVIENDAVVKPEAAIAYGMLIQAIITFLIVGLVLFFIVKGLNKMKKPPEATKPAAKPADVVLLEEIRDLIKTR